MHPEESGPAATRSVFNGDARHVNDNRMTAASVSGGAMRKTPPIPGSLTMFHAETAPHCLLHDFGTQLEARSLRLPIGDDF